MQHPSLDSFHRSIDRNVVSKSMHFFFPKMLPRALLLAPKHSAFRVFIVDWVHVVLSATCTLPWMSFAFISHALTTLGVPCCSFFHSSQWYSLCFLCLPSLQHLHFVSSTQHKSIQLLLRPRTADHPHSCMRIMLGHPHIVVFLSENTFNGSNQTPSY